MKQKKNRTRQNDVTTIKVTSTTTVTRIYFIQPLGNNEATSYFSTTLVKKEIGKLYTRKKKFLLSSQKFKKENDNYHWDVSSSEQEKAFSVNVIYQN